MELETIPAASGIYGPGKKNSPLTSPREAANSGKDISRLAK